jgi:hypothetical protein
MKLKILADSPQVVYKDVQMDARMSLYELHLLIVELFNLPEDKLCSFALYDANYELAAEFHLEAFEEHIKQMKEQTLSSIYSNPEVQLEYHFDFLNEKKFYLELLEQNEEAVEASKVIEEKGELPEGFIQSPPEEEMDLLDSLLDEEIDGGDDLFDQDDLENLDDYEEYL